MAMSSPAPLIVRDEAASTLRRAFDAGREGTPEVVVVRGEAGIGKTRLLQEFRAEASRLDPHAVFAVGQCVDMGEIGSPYTPIRRLLRDLQAQLDEALLSAVAPAMRSALGGILPELSSPDSTSASPAAPLSADTVSEALGALLEALSAERHLVLIIEDLHWADTATLALLKTLSFTLRGRHLTVVMSYRTDDVGRGHPLRGVLADLERNRSVTFVDVERLSRHDAARLTRMLAPELDHEGVDGIVERSDGLPFFIEELVAFADSRLPETLRDLLLARVETLSVDAREAVDLLAAGGVHVDSDLLEKTAAGRIERDRLHAGLREGLATGILTADDAGYAFRHALLQEAVHDDLLPGIRSELHARYAVALDERVAAGHRELAAEAAEHWGQARDVARAFDAMLIARLFAREAGTDLVASQIGEQMLASWPQIPDAEQRVGMARLEFFAETARQALNDPQRALRIARAGLAEARPEQRAERANLLNVSTFALSNAGDAAAAFQASVEALTLLDRDDPETRTLLIECMLARIRVASLDLEQDDIDELDALSAEAIGLVESIDDPVLRSRVLDAAALLHAVAGRLADALVQIERQTVTGLPLRQAQVNLITRLDVLVRMGRYADAVAAGSRRAAAVPEGAEAIFGVDLNLAEAMYGLGEAEEAGRLARGDLATIVGPQVMSSFGWRLLCLADIWDDRPAQSADRRRRHAADIAALSADDSEELAGWGTCIVEGALNEAQSASDAGVRAALVDQALAGALDIERAQPELGIARPHVVTAARALADATLAGADAEALERIRRMIADTLRRHGRDEATPAIEAIVAAEEVRSSAVSGDAAGYDATGYDATGDGSAGPAVSAWRAASELAADGFVPVRHRWYARYRFAEALLDAGERDEASAVLDEIAAGAGRHGISTVARWARELSARAGLSGAPAGALPRLTARETQVLELVASGLTNPEIGERLFISPKTASVHVSAILAKIGAANRTEAAAFFHRGSR